MAKFFYKAKSRNETATKTLSGVVEAKDIKQAVLILKNKEMVPFVVKPTEISFFQEINLRFFNKVSLMEVATFTRNLATMVTSGLPLTEALSLLKIQGSSKMISVVEDILRGVEGGETLAICLARHPAVFSKVYVALVKAGESAGVLDKILQRLADTLEKQREFQGRVKNAMLYPIIIVTAMLIVMVLMMLFVIPKLTGLYKEFGAKLPGPTQFLMDVSGFMIKYFPILLLLGLGLVYGFRLYSKTAAGRKKIDGFILKIPIIGNLQQFIILAEICRTLGLLISAGVPIVDALNIVAGAAGNVIYEDEMKEIGRQVEKGFSLAKSLSANEIFPPLVFQLVSIGEETGKMDEVLGKVSHFYETESDEKLKALTTAIEPLIMIVLGVGVGFLIIAIILPIYNLTSQF